MKLLDILKESQTNEAASTEQDNRPKLYRIHKLSTDEYFGVFNGPNAEFAKLKASKYYKNKEIATSEDYEAEQVTKPQLDKERKELLKQLKNKTEYIDYGLQPS